MERNFTIKTVGYYKGTKRYIARKLFSFLFLFLFMCTIGNANALLDLEVTSTDVTCPGANDGTATAHPIDGWAPFTYTWSNGDTTQTITNLSPGIYEVTVIDVDGAIEIGATIVGEDGLDLFMSASYETCVGAADATASVNVSGGTGNYTYLWSTGETFVVASGLSEGTYTVTVTDTNGCTAVGSIDVELSPEGIWLMPVGTDADCGLDNGSAYSGVMTGTPPYIFEWSNGATTDTVTGLAPGTYSVTVTDVNGCTNAESVTIEALSDLSVSISGQDPDCNSANGSATVSVSGGTPPFIYEWSNGGNTATIDGLSAGTYTVTVSDATGCENIISIELEDSDIEIEISTEDSDCNENNGTATVSVITGTPPYTYQWSNGANTAMISALAPGVYSVTVTDDNGCTEAASATVDGDEVNGGTIDTDDELEVCAGDGIDDIVDVDLSGNSGPNSTWVMTDPSGNIIGIFTGPPFNFDGAGTGNCVIWHLSYQDGLTGLEVGNNVADLDGCFDFSNSITVIRIDPDGGEITTNDPTSVCVGDGIDDFIDVSVSGADGPNTAWIITDDALNILALPPAPPFNFEGAGEGICLIWYIVYADGLTGLSEGANAADLEGCFELSNSITVTRNGVPSINLSVNNVSCNGAADGSITANVSGGGGNYTYEWSNGANSATISDLAPGVYSITVTDDNGCTASESATIVEPSALAVSASGIDETCIGSNDGSATASPLGGTPPYSYAWSNGGTTATIENLAPGTYTATVTDDNGCTAVSNEVLIGSNGISSCSAMVTSSYNEGVDISTFGGSDGEATASANGGTLPYSYQWSNGQTGATASNLSAGTYSVTITDQNDCTCTAEVELNDPSKIGDFVWEDTNKNGIQDNGENGIGGVIINLSGSTDSGINVMRSTTSNPDGSYAFDGLLPGTYNLSFETPSGYRVTSQDVGIDETVDSDVDPATGMTEDISLGLSVCNNDVDAGLFPCISIGDFVFYDTNRDGIQQPWEAGVPNINIRLKGAGPDGIICTDDDVIVDGDATDNTGRYLFECVDPGTYYIEFGIDQSEYFITLQDQGGDDELDSDADPDNGKTAPFTVVEGMPDDLSYDAGIFLICEDYSYGGQIGFDQEICPGEFPNTLVSISMPTGGYGATEFLWMRSNIGGPLSNGSWMEIPNSNAPTYDPPQLTQTTFFIRCVRREGCTEFIAESNIVVIVVNSCIGGPMTSLNAEVHGQTEIEVTWLTAPESSLYSYQVQRSADGIDFETLGTVSGQGDQQTMNEYSFMDEHPRIGRNIYRIIREDLTDGQQVFSELVEAMFNIGNERFFVYPNPASGTLFVESIYNMNGNATLQLFDATGKLLETVIVDENIGKSTIDFTRYASGPYFIKVKYADKDATDVIRIIKE